MKWWIIGPKVAGIIVPPLFLAFGVTIGGGLFGALGHWLVGQSSTANASEIAFKIRIWAVAVAIGGALTALENFEKSVSAQSLLDIAEGGATLLSAYAGAEFGYWIIRWWMMG